MTYLVKDSIFATELESKYGGNCVLVWYTIVLCMGLVLYTIVLVLGMVVLYGTKLLY